MPNDSGPAAAKVARPHPRLQVWVKFLLLCAAMGGYFAYLCVQYDFRAGAAAALVSWSFFVLCTPVADAGFILAFPLRLLFGVRMLASQAVVTAVAAAVNAAVLLRAREYYDTTFLTRVMEKILLTPNPYWGIILLSGAGTFLSVHFGDQVMDVIHRRDLGFFHSHHFKYELALLVFFVAVLWGYYELAVSLGLENAL